MAQKLLFALTHYGVLLLFAASCWGYGQALLGRTLAAGSVDSVLGHGLRVCAGLGVWVCALQVLGVAGALTFAAIVTVAAAGWLAGLPRLIPALREAQAPVFSSWRGPQVASVFVLIAAAGVLAAPLRPPHIWDELAYHLPHAREWAQAGSLVVSEWLRYPWFPYNTHLLFAAGLVAHDDVMPHLVHAMTGLLTTLLLYRLALREHGRLAACLAAMLWLWLSNEDYASAYIDMAITLFVLAAYIAFGQWREQPGQRAWLALSAFMLGLAIGSKYQALSFLPLLAAGIAWVDRRPRNWLLAAAGVALPCAYWYVRNAIMTGDPVDPLGGHLFGFTDWNAIDLDYQLIDIRRVYGWPAFPLWAALGALVMRSSWQRPADRSAVIFCAWSFAVWLVTSHYPRYLMPAYPLLLLLGAKAGVAALAVARGRIDQWVPVANRPRWLLPALLVLAALPIANWSKRKLSYDWARVATTPQERLAVLRGQVWEYMDTLEYLSTLAAPRIYQNGMEGVLYYLPRPVRGDHFGRWRYRDYMSLAPAQLAAKLRGEQIDTLVLRLETNGQLLSHPEFAASFQTLKTARRFGIYRVNPTPP